MSIVFGALIAFLVSYLGVGRLSVWASKHGMLAIPGERSSHLVATPTGGGAVIAAVTMLGVLCVWLMRSEWAIPGLAIYLIAAVFVAAVGWLDDSYVLSAQVRFGVQAVAALVMMLWVGVFESIDFFIFGVYTLGWIGYPLTFLWIVGLINAYNFMDGIDGNAGGIGAAVGAMWALVAWRLDEPILVALGLLVSASSIGFLGHNWQPASIFMGDVGSTFLGFTFAAMPLLGLQGTGNPRLLVIGSLLVAPCICDSVYTFLRRLLHGEPVFQAHRTYLYQRLATIGYPHWVGSGFYLLLSLAMGVCGWLYLIDEGILRWQLLVLVVFILATQVGVVHFAERIRKS